MVKHEADLKFETLKMKNQSLIENLQDLQHEKNTLSQQMALEKEHMVRGDVTEIFLVLLCTY